MKKILIISYYWPPGSGAGVQRWLKFAKYLPEYGWEPLVLTIDPQYATYPATDPTIEKEISPVLKVFRTKATDWFRFLSRDKSKITSAGFAINPDNSFRGKIFRFIRGNFFIPDPRRGWNRYAFNKAAGLIGAEGINHVITTSPPHSSQLIGLKLKKRFPGIKWIADLRDPWTDIYYYNLFYPTFVARYIDACYERNVIRKADRIISVGKSLAEIIASKNRGMSSNIHIIPNGFDEDDFRDIKVRTPERFTITYAGTLSEAYPLKAFLTALDTISGKGFDFLLRFVGTVPESIISGIRNSVGSENIEFIPFTSHTESISYMANSSILLLIIPDHKNNKTIITGKLFEYIAARKPVLLIGPEDGDAADYLRRCGQTGIFSGKNPDEIEEFVLNIMDSGASILLTEHPGYSRKILTQKLAEALNCI
jgi:glycosyltransferase involved in cell wall biosynthesis